MSVRVWDSTSEVRYLVVPMRAGRRPLGTRSLAGMVTRDAMIGVGVL